ncbi:MAG: hypothetical protein AAF581_02630 [Planctomycetota bacterium]
MAKQNRETALGKRLRQWRRTRADERLFHHLSELFELEARDEDVLISLADEHRLVRISEIFVRPSLWQSSPDPRNYSDAEIGKLHTRVFGSNAANTEASTSDQD